MRKNCTHAHARSLFLLHCVSFQFKPNQTKMTESKNFENLIISILCTKPKTGDILLKWVCICGYFSHSLSAVCRKKKIFRMLMKLRRIWKKCSRGDVSVCAETHNGINTINRNETNNKVQCEL